MGTDPRGQLSQEELDSLRATARQILESRLGRGPGGVQSTAYHEAGHAVAAYLLRRGIDFVSIVRRESHVGVCFPTQTKRVDEEQELLIIWAGTVAEGMMTGWFDEGGVDSDWDRLLDIGVQLCGDRERATVYLCELQRITEDTFTLPPVKAAVEALAQQLLKRRFLRGRAARCVIRGALLDHGGGDGAAVVNDG